MAEFFKEFQRAKFPYGQSDIQHAIDLYIANIQLTKRLAELLKQRVKLDSIEENPWIEEMQKSGIKTEDIRIIKDYLKFKSDKEEKLLKEYKKAKRGFSYSPDYHAIPPQYKRRMPSCVMPEKNKSIILGE